MTRNVKLTGQARRAFDREAAKKPILHLQELQINHSSGESICLFPCICISIVVHFTHLTLSRKPLKNVQVCYFPKNYSLWMSKSDGDIEENICSLRLLCKY
ncbi:hypothetical protein GOODEAATRI_013499 [Goodea atripinnis]|uniref:Uncharacterized protein n=1 Tax=Goodea atripinnis TaxID=208336 RepID=A0ABV0NK04_9TELE